MGQQVYFDGPEPPDGRIWCYVCLAGYKHAAITAQQAAIDAAGNGDGEPRRFRLTAPGAELAVAVTRGISTLGTNFGVLDVCWSHAIALDMRLGGVTPASPQEAAMFSQARELRKQG